MPRFLFSHNVAVKAQSHTFKSALRVDLIVEVLFLSDASKDNYSADTSRGRFLKLSIVQYLLNPVYSSGLTVDSPIHINGEITECTQPT
jgi:hypothetical protein